MPERGYFFVCGAAKSGTTWLQRVLYAHPEIQCSGEGHFVERFCVPLLQVMRDYIGHQKFVSGAVYEGQPYYPPMEDKDLIRMVRTFIVDRMLARQPGPEVRWLGDKTPRYTACLEPLINVFPEARFINIVRDPRDLIMARVHHARRTGVTVPPVEDAEKWADLIRRIGADWMRSLRPVESFAAQSPGIVLTVQYENMLADPEGEARRLFGFLGVAADDALVRKVARATSFEAMTGRKPGEENATSFLRKGVAGDWIGRLEARALSALDEACGDTMRAYGYC